MVDYSFAVCLFLLQIPAINISQLFKLATRRIAPRMQMQEERPEAKECQEFIEILVMKPVVSNKLF